MTLDDLIALNHEILALARAGIPLDKGLCAIARDLPRRLGRHAERLGVELRSGQSLVDSMDRLGKIPPPYRVVILAGLRSGRLASALEGMASAASRVRELRRVTAVAMVYPIVLLVVASVVFVYTTQNTWPVLLEVYRSWEFERPAVAEWAVWISEGIVAALPWLWGGFGLTALFWWLRGNRSTTLGPGGMRWLWGAAALVRASQIAIFLELLALLVEQRVPLDEAIGLSADATGDARIRRAGEVCARQVREGTKLMTVPDGMPPLVGWLLLAESRPEHLVSSLRRFAASYEDRADSLGRWIGIYLPIVLAAGLGGCATLIYTVLLMAPFYDLLRRLG